MHSLHILLGFAAVFICASEGHARSNSYVCTVEGVSRLADEGTLKGSPDDPIVRATLQGSLICEATHPLHCTNVTVRTGVAFTSADKNRCKAKEDMKRVHRGFPTEGTRGRHGGEIALQGDRRKANDSRGHAGGLAAFHVTVFGINAMDIFKDPSENEPAQTYRETVYQIP